MTEAVGSLMLRFAERKDVFGKEMSLQRLRLVEPVRTLRTASLDLTLSKKYATKSYEEQSIIDMNWLIVEYGDYLSERVLLPPAELAALDELVEICDRLERADIPNGDVESIKYHIDFAPRLKYLLKFFPMSNIWAGNRNAVERSLAWSRAEPAGPGLKFWEMAYANGNAPDPIGDDLITYHTSKPCQTTRSAIRGAAAEDPWLRQNVSGMSWQYIGVGDRRLWLDQYDSDPSVLNRLK